MIGSDDDEGSQFLPPSVAPSQDAGQLAPLHRSDSASGSTSGGGGGGGGGGMARVLLVVEEMPLGAPPGSKPMRTPLATLEVLLQPEPGGGGEGGRCTLPLAGCGALVLRLVAPGPGLPVQQDFDKQVKNFDSRMRRHARELCLSN